MRLKGEEYSKRLREYSDDTIRLISDIYNGGSKEAVLKANDITTDSELDEKQVVERLRKLLEEYKART